MGINGYRPKKRPESFALFNFVHVLVRCGFDVQTSLLGWAQATRNLVLKVGEEYWGIQKSLFKAKCAKTQQLVDEHSQLYCSERSGTCAMHCIR